MIIQREKEVLSTYFPTSFDNDDTLIQSERRFFKNSENGVLLAKDDSALSLDKIIKQSDDMDSRWRNYFVDNSQGTKFTVTNDCKIAFKDSYGTSYSLDMTEHAFAQLCQKLGVPTTYIRKCFDEGKDTLAVQNLKAWIEGNNGGFMFRTTDNVARAVVSDSYVPFDNYKILRTLKHTMDSKRFIPTQVFLSQDKLHVRFVDFTPLPVNDGTGKSLYAGFILSSSSVGTKSMKLNFFIFRPVCTNGLTLTRLGGTLFSMPHTTRKEQQSKMEVFTEAFKGIDALCDISVNLIKTTSKKILTKDEMAYLVQKARGDLKLSQKNTDILSDVIATKYDQTQWGVINSLTEFAQNFDNLDTRIDIENWAGNYFAKAA